MNIEAIAQNAEITSTSSCGRYFNRVTITYEEYDFLTEKVGIENKFKGYGDDYIEMDYHGEFIPLIEMARKQKGSKGNWLYYTGNPCEKCGRNRVEMYENGEEICEKCLWNKTKKAYEYSLGS